MNGIVAAELADCLFKESNDGFLVFDPQSLNIIEANPTAQRLSRFSRDWLITKTLGDVLECQAAESLRDLLNACEVNSFFHSREGYALVRKESTSIPVNVSVSRLHSASAVLGLLAIRDVSGRCLDDQSLNASNQELHEILRALRDSHDSVIQQERWRSLGQMASGASHSLNNLLCPIIAYTDLLLARDDLPLSAVAQLSQVSSAAQGLADIVDRLQGVAPSESRFESTDLGELLTMLRDLTRPKWYDESIQQCGHPLEFKLEVQRIPKLECSPNEIRELLVNLIANATEAMPSGGTISVRLYVQNSHACIEVVDDGVGMSKQDQARCFDPFFTTKDQAVGLGLSVCQGIVQRHDGALEIRSIHHEGTNVRLRLPCKATKPRPPVQRRNATLPGGLRVLYIDDNLTVRNAVEAMLQTMGCHVITAESGAVGIAKLEVSSVDVVITDLGMPGLDGGDVARHVKEYYTDTPVVVLSGWDEARIRKRFTGGLTADMILTKPPTISQMHDALVRLVLGQDIESHADA